MTVANLITLSRMALIPVYAFLLHRFLATGDPAFRWGALLLFLLMALSDWLDGIIARRMSCQSSLGQFLDPAADKLLMLTSVIFLCWMGSTSPIALPGWYGLVYIVRDSLLLGLYLLLGTVVSPVVVAPSRMGKFATIFFFLVVGSTLAGAHTYLIRILIALNSSALAVSLIFYVHDGYRQWKPIVPNNSQDRRTS